MRVFRQWQAVPAPWRGAVAVLGNLDGVHRGHQALLRLAIAEAIRRDRPAGAVVFEPHPVAFFRPDAPSFRLTPFDARARLLRRFGVDALYVLKFDAGMAARSPEAFVREVLAAGLGLSHVVVGAEFQFGHGRAGDAAMLEALGSRHGIAVTRADLVGGGPAAKISSTRIREALREGRPRDAARDLGHWWTLEGHVRPGDRRGRTIGFPTANIALKGTLEPALGVYAVRVTLGGTGALLEGVANFGRRPTFGKHDVLLEVHLFDFAGDLYGKRLSVAFIDFVRPERRFASVAELKAQIAADAEMAREMLARQGPHPDPPRGGGG